MAKSPTTPASSEKLIRENATLKEQLKACRGDKLASNVTPIVREAIRWPSIAVGSWAVAHELAGKSTMVWADVSAKVVGAETAKEVVDGLSKTVVAPLAIQIFVVAALLVAVWNVLRVKRLNRDLVRDLGTYRRLYELSVDPNRSSSGLGHDGQTRKEDDP
jgi:hypothetical protein